jgi:AcrR family transcriptional regulator
MTGSRKFKIVEVLTDAQGSETQPTSSRDLRKSAILQAAKEVFAEDGYAQFSARSVAKRVGVSLSTVQHYFPTLQILLFETISSLVEGYVQGYRTMGTDADVAPLDRLDNILADLLTELRKPAVCASFLQLWALAQRDPDIGMLVETLYEDYRLVLKDLVQAVTPAFNDEQASVAATLMAAQIEGLMIFLFRGGASLPAWDQLAHRARKAWLDLCG